MSLDPKKKTLINKVITHTQTNLVFAGHEDGQINLFDFTSNKITNSLQQAHSTSISSLALSNSGLQLISGCHHGEIKVWDLRKLGTNKNPATPLCTVPSAHLQKYDEGVMSLTVHPKSTSPFLISTGADSLVKIYEMFV